MILLRFPDAQYDQKKGYYWLYILTTKHQRVNIIYYFNDRTATEMETISIFF